MLDALVSVIIPCYNAERYLEETIRSVLAQTYPNVELVLVDDGSSDGTRAIIDCHADDAVCHFGPNRGASAARTKGTELASGAYVQYLDADDRLRSEAIEKRVAALEAEQADVAYSGYQRLLPNQEGEFQPGPEVHLRMEEVHADPELATLTDFWVPPVALTYRRSLVERIGSWNEDLPIIQDARFLQDAAYHGGTFVRVPEVLGDYREHHEGSLSSGDDIAFRLDCFNNAVAIENRWQVAQNGLGQERRRALKRLYQNLAENFFWDRCDTFYDALAALERIDTVPSVRLRVYRRLAEALGLSKAAAFLSPLKTVRHLFQ